MYISINLPNLNIFSFIFPGINSGRYIEAIKHSPGGCLGFNIVGNVLLCAPWYNFLGENKGQRASVWQLVSLFKTYSILPVMGLSYKSLSWNRKALLLFDFSGAFKNIHVVWYFVLLHIQINFKLSTCLTIFHFIFSPSRFLNIICLHCTKQIGEACSNENPNVRSQIIRPIATFL